MAVDIADIRSMLDLESIIAADILVCSRISRSYYQNGAGARGPLGARASALLDCLLGQKQKLPTSTAKSLPMGVIVEIGRALDMETRMNLMLANKLFMEAFSKEERNDFRNELAAQSLTNTWHSLMEKGIDKNYSMFFEFESADKQRMVRLNILPGRVRFVVDIESRESLQRLFPMAEGFADEIDGEFIVATRVATIDNFSKNKVTPKTIVSAIQRLTIGMQMLPPIAYTRNPSWFKKMKKLIGFNNAYQTLSMQPVFDKLALYHIAAIPPPQIPAVQDLQNETNA
jgi:hypothetical protein